MLILLKRRLPELLWLNTLYPMRIPLDRECKMQLIAVILLELTTAMASSPACILQSEMLMFFESYISIPSLLGMFMLLNMLMPNIFMSSEFKKAIVQLGDSSSRISLTVIFLQSEKMTITPGLSSYVPFHNTGPSSRPYFGFM